MNICVTENVELYEVSVCTQFNVTVRQQISERLIYQVAHLQVTLDSPPTVVTRPPIGCRASWPASHIGKS
jgi:hypothetical protein